VAGGLEVLLPFIALVLHSREACSALTVSSRTLVWMKLEFSLLSSSITDRVELGEGSDSLVELAVVGGLDLFVSWFLV
jgi:hypothetical protein